MAHKSKRDESCSYGIKKKPVYFTEEELDQLDKKELIKNVLRLQLHNNQLRNILTKRKISVDDENVEVDSFEYSKGKIKKRDIDFSKYRKRHIFLKFIYLGWDYQGFVIQENTGETIEGHIFDALIKTCLIADRQTSNYHRCGRTDKGVSASSQVISIDVRSRLAENDYNDDNELPYCKMLNRLLPEDIRVVSWCSVPDGSSSRFNCIMRAYKYYFIKGQLNINAMVEAASYLLGEHDFRNFCKMDVGNGVVHFNRNIKMATINKFSGCDSKINDEFDVYVLKIVATAFLWHQIRCIMSILLSVGENKEKPTVVKDLLDVDKVPRKPQYQPANYIPLILQDTQFDIETGWKYDDEEIELIILKFQKQWALHQIKASQILDIIKDIKNYSGLTKLPDFQTSGLICGYQPNVYKKILERPVCESLENRIDHFVKKQRIEKKESPPKQKLMTTNK